VFVFEKLSDQEIFDFIKKNLPKILDRCSGILINDENILLIAKLGN
jgi:hypothetical protein